MLLHHGIRKKKQYRLLLIGSAEEEKVPLLLERQSAVRPDRVDVVRIENGKAMRLHACHKLAAILDKEFIVY
jgi:hypothetical protein